MPAITPQSRVQRKPDVLSAEINGEVVMMSAELAEYYGLDPVAADIWGRLAQSVAVAQLVVDLTQAYDGDPSVIETDVLDLLDSFAAKGLVVVDA